MIKRFNYALASKLVIKGTEEVKEIIADCKEYYDSCLALERLYEDESRKSERLEAEIKLLKEDLYKEV